MVIIYVDLRGGNLSAFSLGAAASPIARRNAPAAREKNSANPRRGTANLDESDADGAEPPDKPLPTSALRGGSS